VFQKDGGLNLEDADVARIQDDKLDVIIDLGIIRLSKALSAMASYGVWTAAYRTIPDFAKVHLVFWEVMENKTTYGIDPSNVSSQRQRRRGTLSFVDRDRFVLRQGYQK